MIGSGHGSDGGSGRLMTSTLSEEGGDSMFTSPSTRRPKITMKLQVPSELLPENAEGASGVSQYECTKSVNAAQWHVYVWFCTRPMNKATYMYRETVPCPRHWQNTPSRYGTNVKNKCLVMNIWWESTMFDMWVFCWFTPQMSHIHKYVVVVMFHIHNLCAFLFAERFGEFSYGIAACHYCQLHEEHLSLSVSVTICHLLWHTLTARSQQNNCQSGFILTMCQLHMTRHPVCNAAILNYCVIICYLLLPIYYAFNFHHPFYHTMLNMTNHMHSHWHKIWFSANGKMWITLSPVPSGCNHLASFPRVEASEKDRTSTSHWLQKQRTNDHLRMPLHRS